MEQLGGQLRAESRPNEGACFSFLIPFELARTDSVGQSPRPKNALTRTGSRNSSDSSELESLVEALQSNHMKESRSNSLSKTRNAQNLARPPSHRAKEGEFDVTDSRFPIKSVKIDAVDADKPVDRPHITSVAPTPPDETAKIAEGGLSGLLQNTQPQPRQTSPSRGTRITSNPESSLRVLVVEVN